MAGGVINGAHAVRLSVLHRALVLAIAEVLACRRDATATGGLLDLRYIYLRFFCLRLCCLRLLCLGLGHYGVYLCGIYLLRLHFCGLFRRFFLVATESEDTAGDAAADDEHACAERQFALVLFPPRLRLLFHWIERLAAFLTHEVGFLNFLNYFFAGHVATFVVVTYAFYLCHNCNVCFNWLVCRGVLHTAGVLQNAPTGL